MFKTKTKPKEKRPCSWNFSSGVVLRASHKEIHQSSVLESSLVFFCCFFRLGAELGRMSSKYQMHIWNSSGSCEDLWSVAKQKLTGRLYISKLYLSQGLVPKKKREMKESLSPLARQRERLHLELASWVSWCLSFHHLFISSPLRCLISLPVTGVAAAAARPTAS